jgi:hypothetical protein
MVLCNDYRLSEHGGHEYKEKELIGKHFSMIVHPEGLPNISRNVVLPRLRGKVTGTDLAPKLFDKRRTNEWMTKTWLYGCLQKKSL